MLRELVDSMRQCTVACGMYARFLIQTGCSAGAITAEKLAYGGVDNVTLSTSTHGDPLAVVYLPGIWCDQHLSST